MEDTEEERGGLRMAGAQGYVWLIVCNERQHPCVRLWQRGRDGVCRQKEYWRFLYGRGLVFKAIGPGAFVSQEGRRGIAQAVGHFVAIGSNDLQGDFCADTESGYEHASDGQGKVLTRHHQVGNGCDFHSFPFDGSATSGVVYSN